MGLSPLLLSATRQQWARARAAMCNALPVGFATPRRLSSAFLSAERQELAQYRDDARRIIRDQPLVKVHDPATGLALPPHWWKRRRCPPPRVLQQGENVLVKRESDFCKAIFEGLVGTDRVRVALDGRSVVISDLDVMGLEETPRASEVPPMQVLQSPKGALSVSPQRTRQGVECEVDVAQLAKSIRLLDRKKELLSELKSLNDAAIFGIDQGMRERYCAIMAELDTMDQDLGVMFVSEPPPRNSLIVSPGLITPSPKRQKSNHIPQLPPEHLAKNVDFRSAEGMALLAKAMARDSLGRMGSSSKLCNLPLSARADMMQCVSACVAVLIRAKATRDFRSVERMIREIRVRYPRNMEALEAIQEAARTFDPSSNGSI